MPGRPSITVFACVCAAALAGCGGGGGTIPEQEGEALLTQLDQIRETVAAGECETAEQQALALESTVAELPSEVEKEVRQGLSEAAQHLAELIDDPNQCVAGTSGATGPTGATDDPEEQSLEPAVSTPSEPEPEPETDEDASPAPSDEGGGGAEGGDGGAQEPAPPPEQPPEQPADTGGDFGGGSNSGGIGTEGRER